MFPILFFFAIWGGWPRASVCDLRAWRSSLHDRKREPGSPRHPYHSLPFLSASCGVVRSRRGQRSRIRDLSYKPGVGVNAVHDFQPRELAAARPQHPTTLIGFFVDTSCWRSGWHVAQTYGGNAAGVRGRRGGLESMAGKGRPRDGDDRRPRWAVCRSYGFGGECGFSRALFRARLRVRQEWPAPMANDRRISWRR